MKIYGLKELSAKVPELLKKKVKYANQPDFWKWQPHKPKKIANIKQHVEFEKNETKFAARTNYKPNGSRQNIVLVFALGNLTYGIIQHLEKHSIKYFYLNYVQFISNGRVEYSVQEGEMVSKWQIGDLKLNIEDVAVVIWNRPKYPLPLFEFEMIPQNGTEEIRSKFLFKRRWAQVLRDMSNTFREDCIWLPGDIYTGDQSWQQKVSELFLFRKNGLNVPPTIFTNDIKKLRIFSSKYGERLLLREFCSPPFSFPPVEININDIDEEALSNSPCTFQKYINKKYEYRVVVLGDKIWPFQIDSQKSSLANRDWRVHDDENVSWRPATFPESFTNKLISVSKIMGLNWCSIDVILGTDNIYYVLEINRPGAHYWLDLFVGFDITKEIIEQYKEVVDVIK